MTTNLLQELSAAARSAAAAAAPSTVAIGRRGQNVRLASKLVGWDIEIMTHDELAEALERAASAVPVLLVEQNLAVVRRLAGDAVVIAAGQVAWTGRGGELLADPELTRSLLSVNAAGGH